MLIVYGNVVGFSLLLFIIAVVANCIGQHLIARAPFTKGSYSNAKRLAYAFDAFATLALIASVVEQQNLLIFVTALAIVTLVGTGITYILLSLAYKVMPHRPLLQ